MIRLALPCGHFRPADQMLKIMSGQTAIQIPFKSTAVCPECGATFEVEFSAVAPKPVVAEEPVATVKKAVVKKGK